MSAPRYLVGIDLGTTHTVVAYAPLETDGAEAISLFELEQLVAPGEVAARPLLPSLRYHPAPGELAEADRQLPWAEPPIPGVPSGVVGELAAELGAKVPGRLVASAKSWLSHGGVDRSAAILPWGAAEGVERISPVAASASYLAHVRAVWNHHHPHDPLERQELVLTVPASFDEVARTLTVQAATLAGLHSVRLLEEPQAACYHWLSRHEAEVEQALGDTRLLLVCDVGGGTTDLTLVQVSRDAEGPVLTRIGVGDHLMLGGDNMDLALAHVAEGRLAAGGARLSAAALSQLTQQCHRAKERLLAADGPEQASVTVLGAGARLVGGARTTELSREEVHALVVEGFFPAVDLGERPRRARGAIVEFGLPYAADPAVSRHVAAFLARHAQAGRAALGECAPAEGPVLPDAVLLNGGVFRSGLLSRRLLDLLGEWRGEAPRVLHNDQPDRAVARGAVAYALARRGRGRRIGGGSARSYFLLLEGPEGQPRQALCVLPRGTEEGRELRLRGHDFALRLGQPVAFHLFSSNADGPYEAGELVSPGEEFHPLPPLATVLSGEGGGEVPVELEAQLTEVGTLAMDCVSRQPPERRWQLELQLRTTGMPEVTSVALPPRFGEAAERIGDFFGSRNTKVAPREVKGLRKDLERLLGRREEWDTPLLRELFGVLWDGMGRRRRSADHERVWLNLAGFCLRPGYGYPLDDWRLEQLWSLYGQGLQFVPEAPVWAEWWTLWRRVSGGLSEAAQITLLEDLAYYLQPPGKALVQRPKGAKKQGYDDMVRLVGSLERLPAENKAEVGSWLAQRLRKPSESPQTWWALGRLGARVPFYGSAHHVVAPALATEWLQQALAEDWKRRPQAAFASALLARMSGDRERDLDPNLREQVAERLQTSRAPASWVQMVQSVSELDQADAQRVFGDSLPPGLRLMDAGS